MGKEKCRGGEYRDPKCKPGQGFLSSDEGKVLKSQDPEPLRPHKFIGPFYVHDMMDGKTIAAWRRDEI